MKDLRRSPDVKLEVTSYDDLIKIVNQLVEDNCGTPTPMDLDAIIEESCAEKTDENKVEEQKCPEEDLTTIYGQDGSIYYLSPKGKGKGPGKGGDPGGKGAGGFDGNCSWCGK